MKSIRILLVDDHTMLRDGIAAILKQVEDFEIVGGVSSGEEAVSIVGDLKPDVILMDIIMGGMTGIEATRWIKEQEPAIKIIIVSSEVKKELVSNGIKCGIDGYLPKDASKADLVEAIRQVMKGEKFFDSAITSLVFEDFCKGEKRGRKKAPDLTKRETDVLELVADGNTNQEVADKLFISVKTVETHKTNILEKLGLRNTAELVKYAIRNNIISID